MNKIIELKNLRQSNEKRNSKQNKSINEGESEEENFEELDNKSNHILTKLKVKEYFFISRIPSLKIQTTFPKRLSAQTIEFK